MPYNVQRQQPSGAGSEGRSAGRARRARRRTLIRLAVTGAVVVLASNILVDVGFGAGVADAATVDNSAEPTPPRVTPGPCRYTETPDEPPARPVPLPPDPRRTPDKGTVTVVLKTNLGKIPLTLNRAKAPCTVQSFIHLVRHRFYNRTICHRLTAYNTLKVLQCGDPSGTGEGGPGYRYKDELPTDLQPAPGDPTGTRRIYPRGVLAMANAGPDTNGSQFFLVYADSVLRPNYTIFGTVGETGLRTLDRVAAGGVAPTPDDPAPVDGMPALRTEIIRAKFGC
jgi:peptidyl-prolyl cis-trans isomerase B (cyclophilin B)